MLGGKRLLRSLAVLLAGLAVLLTFAAYASSGEDPLGDGQGVGDGESTGVALETDQSASVPGWPNPDEGTRRSEPPDKPTLGIELGRVEGAGVAAPLAFAASLGSDDLVAQVAAALRDDPLAIYNYVKTEIAFDPIFGLKRSPDLTILERTGTDADQAQLLVELFSSAGISATYKYGTLSLPYDLAASWARVEEGPSIGDTCNRILNALAGGEIPFGTCTGTAYVLNHVWVEATISAKTYQLDPSIKHNERTVGIDVQTELGYDRTTFLNRAETGATIGPNSVQNLNAGNIATDLDLFAANLIDHLETTFIDSNGRHAFVRDVVGGWEISETPAGTLPQALPYSSTVLESFAAFDQIGAPELRHKITVTVKDNGSPVIIYNTTQAELAGRRLTYQYSGNTGTLRVNGSFLASSVSTLSTQIVEFCFETPMPSTPTDECRDRTVVASDGNTYAFVVDAGRVPQSLLQQRRALLAANQDSFPAGSDEVLGETLHVLGLAWFNENGASERLHEAIADINGYRFHAMAVMSQETSAVTSFGIDVKVNFVHHYSPTLNLDDRDAFFTAGVAQGSGVEHAFLEQLQDKEGISTMRILEIANGIMPVYLGTSANWFGTVRPLLTYNASTLARLDAAINAGFTLVVPEGEVTLNDWTGAGWIEFTSNQEGYIISGSQGGFTTEPGPTDSTDSRDEGNANDGQRAEPPTGTVGDPVNPQTGALTLAEADVSVAGTRPLSIEDLGRFYNSGVADIPGPFGFGWRHSYGWTIQTTSNFNRGLEGPKAVEAARLIAEAFVVQDMIRATAEPVHERREIQAIAIKWGMDQLTDNARVLAGPDGANGTFIELPAGEFSRSSRLPWDYIENMDGSVTLDGRAGEQLDFDEVPVVGGLSFWRLASWTDGNGNTLSLTYDAIGPEGKLTQVTDAVSRTLTFTYTGDLVTEVTDPAGRVHAYEYDGNGDLVVYTNPRGTATAGDPNDFETVYTYDADHQLLTITDPELQTFLTNVYDADGRVSQQTDGRLHNTFLYYGDHLTRVVNPLADDTVVTWTDDGSLQTATDEAGFTTTSNFDASGNLVSLEEPELATSTFKYDALDNLTASTDPLLNTTIFEYDTDSRVTLIRDPELHETAFVYDIEGNLTSTTNPLTQTTTFQYDPAGRLTDIFEPPDKATGARTQMTYDAFGNLVTTTNAELEPSTVFGYEPVVDQRVGQLTSVTDPLGNTTSFEYDAAGNRTKVTDPLLHSTTFEYDGNNLVTKVIDPENRETTNDYDAMNNLTLITRPDTTTIGFVYDFNNRLTVLTDPRGKLWSVQRNDPRGLVTAEIDPLTNRREFVYDGLGRLVKRTDAELRVTDYVYDTASRLKDVLYDDGSAVHNTYDLDGLLDTSSYKAWNAGYQYDALHRVTAEDYAYLGRRVEHVWDIFGPETSFGDRMKLELKVGVDTKDLVTYQYDLAHRLEVMTDDTGATNYAYDLASRLTATTLPNGASIEQTYDAASRIMSVVNKDGGGNPFAVFEYFDPTPSTPLYDDADNVTGVRYTTPQATLPTDYSYDADLDRLTQEQTPRATIGYTYDDAGNRETRTDAAGTTNYAYDDANELLSGGSTTYSYDDDGNLTSKTTPAGTTNFAWDHENRLVGITPPTGSAVTFAYDPLGRQILRQESGAPAVHATYDGLKLLAEGPADLSLGFVYGGGVRRLEHQRDLAGAPDATGYAVDRLGSIWNLTDSTGQARDAYRYDAFGQEALAAGLDDNAFRFGGSFGADQEPAVPGLVRMGFRHYDAETGRFVSRDPIGFLGGDPNVYAYTGNNPATFRDQTGLARESDSRGWLDWVWDHVSVNIGVTASPTGAGPTVSAGVIVAPSGIYWYYGFGLGGGAGGSATLNIGTPPSEGVTVTATARGGGGPGGYASGGVTVPGGRPVGGVGIGVGGGAAGVLGVTHTIQLVSWPE